MPRKAASRRRILPRSRSRCRPPHALRCAPSESARMRGTVRGTLEGLRRPAKVTAPRGANGCAAGEHCAAGAGGHLTDARRSGSERREASPPMAARGPSAADDRNTALEERPVRLGDRRRRIDRAPHEPCALAVLEDNRGSRPRHRRRRYARRTTAPQRWRTRRCRRAGRDAPHRRRAAADRARRTAGGGGADAPDPPRMTAATSPPAAFIANRSPAACAGRRRSRRPARVGARSRRRRSARRRVRGGRRRGSRRARPGRDRQVAAAPRSGRASCHAAPPLGRWMRAKPWPGSSTHRSVNQETRTRSRAARATRPPTRAGVLSGTRAERVHDRRCQRNTP